MSMLVLQPTPITEALLASSTAAEDSTPVYDGGTTYALGARVHRVGTHRVYECLLAGTVGLAPETNPNRWQDVGPTNRYAMFDSIVQTATVGAVDEPLVVYLRPGPAEGVLLAQLAGVAWVEVVQYTEPGGDIVFEQLQRLDSVSIIDHRTWSTAPFKYRRDAFFSGLQPYLAGELRITLQPVVGQAPSCGVLAVGAVADVGSPQRGIGLGGINFSRITTDDFGTTTITQRATARELDFELLATVEQLDTVAQVLEDAKTTPSGFVLSAKPQYSALNVWGLIESWRASVPEADWITVRGRIKGLT